MGYKDMDDEAVQKILGILTAAQKKNNHKFDLMSQKFDLLQADMDEKSSRSFDGICNILDHQTNLLDTDKTERPVSAGQVDSHDDQIERITPKTGVNYIYCERLIYI